MTDAPAPTAQDPQRRIEELEREVERLQALAEGRFQDARLVAFRNGEMTLEGTPMAFLAEFMAQMLEGFDAPDLPESERASRAANYTETRVTHPRLGRLTLTLQRASGKTPHALRREAEDERDALVEALHDAIHRPLGVVPPSAERWYDPRLADRAERRLRDGIRNAPGREPGRDPGVPGSAEAPALTAVKNPDADAPTHRHRKGGLYRLIARGRIEATLEPCAVYEHVESGAVWVRPESEFSDGRFTPLVDEASLPRLAPLPPRA